MPPARDVPWVLGYWFRGRAEALPLRALLCLRAASRCCRAAVEGNLGMMAVDLRGLPELVCATDEEAAGCLRKAVRTFGLHRCACVVLPGAGALLTELERGVVPDVLAGDQRSYDLKAWLSHCRGCQSIGVVFNTCLMARKWVPPLTEDELLTAVVNDCSASVATQIFGALLRPGLRRLQLDWAAYYRCYDWQWDVGMLLGVSLAWRALRRYYPGFRAYLAFSIVPFTGMRRGSVEYAKAEEYLRQQGSLVEFEAVRFEEAGTANYRRALSRHGVKGVGFPKSSACMRLCFLAEGEAEEAEGASLASTGNRFSFLRDVGFRMHCAELPSTRPRGILLQDTVLPGVVKLSTHLPHSEGFRSKMKADKKRAAMHAEKGPFFLIRLGGREGAMYNIGGALGQ